jgi:hypothetical protein
VRNKVRKATVTTFDVFVMRDVALTFEETLGEHFICNAG